MGGGAWAMGAAVQRRVGTGVGGGAWAMGGGMRVHAEDGGAWGWAWAAAHGDRRRRRGRRVMRQRRTAPRRALDNRGRTQLGTAGWRRAVAEAAWGRGLAPSGCDGGEQDGEDAPVEGGGGATAAPLPLLHLNPASSIRGGALARPPPWALSVCVASPCAELAAHPSAELVARGRGWGEDVIAGGGRGGKEGATMCMMGVQSYYQTDATIRHDNAYKITSICNILNIGSSSKP
uniref:Uncharacterized protein n=1 Tax=Oryza sativa subsp. japonica TaxID=39947 RepID=Q8H4N8_ORYSJ|nr:hypothetical protein [Oryza sativa Japonica Group]